MRWHACCAASGVSFLDLQDLALAIAQSGLGAVFSSVWPDFDGVLDALEAGAGAYLITIAVRHKVVNPKQRWRSPHET